MTNFEIKQNRTSYYWFYINALDGRIDFDKKLTIEIHSCLEDSFPEFLFTLFLNFFEFCRNIPKPIQGFKSSWQKLEWSRKTHSLCANEYVTNCNWEGQLRTVVNIYCKTSSPPNFPSDSQSTNVAKGNDFRRVVVTVKSQKSAKYIFRVIFSWHAPVIYIQMNSAGVSGARPQSGNYLTKSLDKIT